jgi:chemotaxis protein methyltransferase CheR
MSALAQEQPESVPVQQPVLQLLRDLVHERTAVYFENDRLDLMIDKLRDRLAAIGCRSYLDYYYLLKYDSQGADEWRRVMDAFSVQETYFWREFDQVRALVEHVVPDWFRRNTGTLHLWSAACATGEEPFSIAMALNEAGWGNHPVEIHAVDASEIALTKARAGIFRERSFRALPAHLRGRYFDPQGDGWVIRPEISAKVHFSWANLAEPATYASLPTPSVIFCRNVFIYFSAQSIGRVVTTFANLLPPRGPLFIGSSESLLKLTNRFELDEVGGAFVYRRSATP